MQESDSELHARTVLESLGYAVERLAEANDRRTCDYLATGPTDALCVEVKDKEDSAQFKSMMEQVALEGRGEVTAPLTRTNPISRVIRNGHEQLTAAALGSTRLRILWFSCLGHDADLVLSQAEYTLYGERTVVPFPTQRGGPLPARPAFFFEQSEFYRLPELDAVVLSGRSDGRLCLNPFSPHLTNVRDTLLARSFGRGVVDPRALEAAGQACIVDGDVDRRSQPAVQAYLAKKYGWTGGVSPMAEIEWKAAIRLPRG